MNLDEIFAQIDSCVLADDPLQDGEFTARQWGEHRGMNIERARRRLNRLAERGIVERRAARVDGRATWAYKIKSATG